MPLYLFHFTKFNRFRNWWKGRDMVSNTAMYTFLRVMIDHGHFVEIQAREIKFCARYIRENPSLCKDIGRDFIRALYDASRLPEIGDIYRDYFKSAVETTNNLPSIEQILHTPTPKLYIMSRISFSLESYLRFIMENVIWGSNDDIYFYWIRSLVIEGRETGSQVADMIRYIILCFHPPNALLQKKVIPRFAVIGKILRLLSPNPLADSVKISIMLDLLCFDPAKDSIMNIEPAILLMNRSAQRHPSVVEWQMSFIYDWINTSWPSLKQSFQRSLEEAFRIAISKSVIMSLDGIYKASKLPSSTKQIIYELIYSKIGIQEEAKPELRPEPTEVVAMDITSAEEAQPSATIPDDLWMFGDFLPHFVQACRENDIEEAEKRFESIMDLSSKVEYDPNSLSDCIAKSANEIIEHGPEGSSVILDVIFRKILNSVGSKIEDLVEIFYTSFFKQCSHAGWLFLKYLTSPQPHNLGIKFYLNQFSEEKLISDLEMMSKYSPESFLDNLSLWLTKYPLEDDSIEHILRIVCSCIDPVEIYKLSWEIENGNISFFDRYVPHDQFFIGSLGWDSFDQRNFWTIIRSEVCSPKNRAYVFHYPMRNLLEYIFQESNATGFYLQFPEAISGIIETCTVSSDFSTFGDFLVSLLREDIKGENSKPLSYLIFNRWKLTRGKEFVTKILTDIKANMGDTIPVKGRQHLHELLKMFNTSIQ